MLRWCRAWVGHYNRTILTNRLVAVRPLKNVFCVTHHFLEGWNVSPRQRDSRHKIGPKKGGIRDIIWQHHQKLWNLRCFQMLSNKKPCTKVLEIQKLVGFDCVFLKMLPNPQFRSYKNGMHQKINPRLPENWHSFYKYDTTVTSGDISAIGFSHVW